METSLLDESGHPASCLVKFDQAILNVSDLDEPAVEATIDKGSLTAPAEGIAMLDSSIGKEFAHILQVLDNRLVRILDVNAFVSRNRWRELSISVDGDGCTAWLNDTSGDTRCVIVLTETGGTVHDTCTGIFGDPWGAQNLEAAIGSFALEEVKERLVALADKGLALELFNHGVTLDLSLLKDVLETTFHAHVHLLCGIILESAIIHSRVDREGQVTGQSPGRGRPSNEVGLLIILKYREGDDNCGIRHFLIVGASLEIGQHGIASRGERHDFGATVDEALIEDLLEGPPDALHVVTVHRLVVVLKIDPATEAADRLLPLL